MTGRPAERPGPDAGKEAWREWARAEWEQIDAAQLSAGVVDHLARFVPLRTAPTLVIYYPMSHELDVTRLLTERHRPATLAATRTPAAGPLTAHLLGGWPLERHRYGFLQPQADTPQLDAGAVDAVLVPGLCFSRDGTRLGHGAGYFDEYLASLAPHALKLGVTPTRLVLDRLPRLPHDVAMTHLATESGVWAVDE